MTATPAPDPADALPPRRDLLYGAFQLYRRTAASRTAIALVAANAIPLVGVLLFGWSLWTILVVYWVENGIVGFWTVPRILLARGAIGSVGATLRSPSMPEVGGLALGSVVNVFVAVFFVVHYGIFWFVHGVFVFALPSFFGASSPIEGFPGDVVPGPGGVGGVLDVLPRISPFGEIAWASVAIAAIALFLSHGWTFLREYLGHREYLTTSAATASGAPYARVVVLHLTILFGAFAIVLIGAPVATLVILVILKTALDLGLHLRRHPFAIPVRDGG